MNINRGQADVIWGKDVEVCMWLLGISTRTSQSTCDLVVPEYRGLDVCMKAVGTWPWCKWRFLGVYLRTCRLAAKCLKVDWSDDMSGRDVVDMVTRSKRCEYDLLDFSQKPHIYITMTQWYRCTRERSCSCINAVGSRSCEKQFVRMQIPMYSDSRLHMWRLDSRMTSVV